MTRENQCKRKDGVAEPFVGKSQVNSCLGEGGRGEEGRGDCEGGGERGRLQNMGAGVGDYPGEGQLGWKVGKGREGG